MTTSGKTNKRKGSDAERYYVNQFKEIGFKHCVTARYGSRLHDDAGVDLLHLPFLTQVKAGFQKNMSPSKVLFNVKEKVQEMFPETSMERKAPIILIHKKQGKPGVKKNEFDELVMMSFEDFKKIINKISKWD
jgi:hypothetical protein